MQKDVSNHIMGSKRNADNRPNENDENGVENKGDTWRASVKKPSLTTLITWNVFKAMESDPQIDLRAALRETQERLENSHDVEALISPDVRNLCCAFLAWQQLGHRAADSLFDFVQRTLKEHERKQNVESRRESITRKNASDNPDSPVRYSRNVAAQKDSCYEPMSQWGGPPKMDFSTSIGLVVKLPVEQQTMMHLTGPVRVPTKLNKCCSRGKPPVSGTASKIDSACCLDKECMERLAKVETETQQLRKRAALFARREAERTELLERAEIAWRDLDSGYQRRLRLAREKEEDYEKQTARLLEERNRYKELCMPLIVALKKKSAIAEKEREKLTQLEQEVCVKACARLELLKNDARADAMLTEHQCKAAQLDRDLALKEEQEMRKQRSLAGAMEAAQVLTHEAEYAQRTELGALKAQVQQAAQELLEEDARTTLLKQRIADYMEEKDEMIEDLEACQTKCDGRMGGLVSNLKNKKDQIVELEKKVMECLCKDPVDRAVEVKRTPSLAALCRCSPSDALVATCSCTSLRSRLLSALLKDLFGGLKSEMENISSQMPCHLLKCLEDKHNWDRATDVKKNVRAYFSRLLLGELDIAIAAVIEKCHAQWVGECCADLRRPPASRSSGHSLRWQEHELEMKTHKMATKLAEKMFLEKAQELAKQAEEILSKDGRPPCECGLHDVTDTTAVYRCLVQPQSVRNVNKTKDNLTHAPVKEHKRDKPNPQQIGNVKKDAYGTITSTLNTLHSTDRSRKKDVKIIKLEKISKNGGGASKPFANQRNLNINAKKPNKSVINKIDLNKGRINAPDKIIKGPHQYAVNMCLCDGKNNTNWKTESKVSSDHKFISHVSSVKQTKPAILFSPEINIPKDNDVTKLLSCTEKCACFHKSPSNTSVDRLIGILTKWKDNLVESQESNIKKALNTDSLFKMTHTSIVNVLQQLCGNMESKKSISQLEQPIISDKNIKPSHRSEITVDKVGDCSRTIISSQIQINQSQYMGAINLDRSNNPVYKSGNNTEDKEQNTHIPLQRMYSANGVGIQIHDCVPIESTNPAQNMDNDTLSDRKYNDVIGYVKQLPIINNLESSISSHKGCEPHIQFLGVTLTNTTLKRSLSTVANQHNDKPHLQKPKRNNLDKLDDEQKSEKNNDKSTNKNNTERENTIAILPKLCENYIQFLGVTLDNANTEGLTKKDTKQKSSYDGLFNQNIRNYNDKSDEKRLKLNANRDLRKKRYAVKRVKPLKVLHLHNECTYKDTYNGVDHLSVNKSVEVSDNKIDGILNKHFDEPCICCPTLDADITNDLEVNTFQLLEDHLKRQLEQFKLSVCKSSCMQNADENNLVTDTLLKVKKLILESASAVTCKCAGNSQASGGSWKRAYSLLQEYLKTKIERVKCLCDTSGQSQDDNLVPRVLSKINCLIENDLQRLKNICQCKNTTSLNTHDFEMHVNGNVSQYIDEINDCKKLTIPNTTEHNYTTNEVVESMFCNFTNSASIPYNKSAQVSFYHSVVTRSCDALKTYSQYSEVQTVDVAEDSNIIAAEDNCTSIINQNDLNIEDENDSKQHNDKDAIELPKDILPFSDAKFTVMPIALSLVDKNNENDSKELEHNEQNQRDLEKINEKIVEPFVPYIGCTINCCCDSNLGCVCTKSAVTTNSDWWKNNNIWNNFTQKRNETEKFSYILSHISSKLPKDVYSTNITEDYFKEDIVQLKNLSQCESNINGNEKQKMYPKKTKESLDLGQECCKIEMIEVSKTNVCESEVSANEENNICLKKSQHGLDIVNGTTNTLTDDNSVQFISLPRKLQRHGILKRNKCEFAKHPPTHLGISDTTLTTDDVSQRSESLSTNCDCVMVPVCHVKMLMENIGSKLVKSECTCDSLKSVCPVHFHKSVFKNDK